MYRELFFPTPIYIADLNDQNLNQQLDSIIDSIRFYPDIPSQQNLDESIPVRPMRQDRGRNPQPAHGRAQEDESGGQWVYNVMY